MSEIPLTWLLFLVASLAILYFSSSLPAGGVPLVRLLIPSWRFYEEVGELCTLTYRSSMDGQEFGPWLTALPLPDSKSLLLNTEWNHYLACQGLVGQLIYELSEVSPIPSGEAKKLAPYQMVCHLLEEEILSTKNLTLVPKYYQFRVCGGEIDAPTERYLLSSVEKLS